MAKKSSLSTGKGKLEDVAKPGETPASPNARPTIAGHQPAIKQDPMVASSDDESKEKEQPFISKSKITIKPISEDMIAGKEETEDDKTKTNDAENEPEEKPEKPKDEAAASTSESAAIDALAKTADSKKTESRKAEENQKHREHIEDLVKSEKYRLPIVEGGHKGSAERIISWIFLILLLLSAGVYLAIDAGYINIGLDLPIELIQN